MTNQQHPITPPPELVEQWYDAIDNQSTLWKQQLATRAAQWGADQELEACIAWFDKYIPGYELVADRLRAARRHKPPSLKGQALEQLDGIAAVFRMSHGGNLVCDTILRALEALPE